MTGEAARLARWQALTVGLLVIAYTGYYVCRSNLSVVQKLIEHELIAGGLSADDARFRLGTIVSVGTLAYALGKFVSGSVADAFGGRRNLLFGMAGSVACTLCFAASGALPLFTAAWFGNRLMQSMGWVGMVKISSRWFSHTSYGRVMGILSLSYLFGDALARELLGRLIGLGLGWRGVFVVAAAVLAGLLVVSAWLIRESPAALGLPEPEAGPGNVFGDAGNRPVPAGLRAVVMPLWKSPGFRLACLISVGVTLLRETFNTWTPTYLAEAANLTTEMAARRSGLFPLFGGVSVLVAGYLGDLLGQAGRAAILCGGLFLAGVVLAILGLADLGGSEFWTVALISAVAFLLIGPYSFLAGAIALDFGAKQGSATASGLIDGFGYLGGILAGAGMAKLSTQFGWGVSFAVLAVVSWLTASVSVIFLGNQRRLGRTKTVIPIDSR
jgi:OPA family glycerol-3-phosphate transporter-like MFS transporter